MNKFELQQQTKAFHVNVIKLCSYFPKNAAGFETAKQLIRAACRAKSKADFIYKIELYWKNLMNHCIGLK